MDKFSRRSALFLFWFIIVSLQIPWTVGEAQQQQVDNKNEEEQPFFGKTLQDTVNVLYDTVSILQKSHQNAWDKVKTIVNELQLQFSPPSIEGGDAADAKGSSTGSDGMGEKMKEAAQKSFETGKHTVEESAKSAGEAVGGTMHKTAEKVKETVSSHEEL